MNQEREEIADQQTFGKGDPEHLVLTQTKALPHPFDECLVPQEDRVGLLEFLRFFGFLAHPSILPLTRLRSPAHLLLP